MKEQQYRQNKRKRTFRSFIMVVSLLLGLLGYLQLEKYGYGLDSLNNIFTVKNENKYSKYITDSIKYEDKSVSVLGATTENAKSVPVLIYHGIVEEVVASGDVLYEDFKTQMISLKQNGYQTITLSELYDFLNNGKSIPNKPIVITFDDGRKDSYYPVDSILKTLDFRAVMFLIEGSIKENDTFHLTSSEVVDMIKTGRWEVGSHSKDGHVMAQIDESGKKGHWLSNKLWLHNDNRLETDDEYANRIQKDLLSSKIELSDEYGLEIKDFAFPFGDFGQNDTNHGNAKNIYLENVKSNYRMAFYQPWGELGDRNYPGVDTFMIRRITIDSSYKDDDLINELDRGQDKDVNHKDSFDKDYGWISSWGEMYIEDGVLKMYSSESESGATSYLRGSELWNKYSLSIDVLVGSETDTFSILANVDRHNNYSYCNFSSNGVSYNEKIEGLVRKGKYWNHSLYYAFPKGFKAGIINDGKTISCLINDRVVVKDDIRNSNTEGIIGFSIWSKSNGAEAIIDNLDSISLE